MKISIELLKKHPDSISKLLEIWHEVLGKRWVPDIPIEEVKKNFQKHLNDHSLPLTLVAFPSGVPVGICSLRENDGIRADLTPWLGSLVVQPDLSKKRDWKTIDKMCAEQSPKFGF